MTGRTVPPIRSSAPAAERGRIPIEAAERSRTAPSRTEREDFRVTSDPALQPEADGGQIKLLGYRELYQLWERQQWATQDLDFSRDRTDWHERFDDRERFHYLYSLVNFFMGEQEVADELAPIIRAAPLEEQRLFLSTQIADEARHVAFFQRFFGEVGIDGQAGKLAERLRSSTRRLHADFDKLFNGLLAPRVDRLSQEPGDRDALVEAMTLYHLVIEGVLALTGQHYIIDCNEREGTLPAFVEGFNNVARDEHRHIAFGVRFLLDFVREDDRYREVIQRMLEEAVPVADHLLDPPWVGEDEWEQFGMGRKELHAFAHRCLSRRLNVIGLVPARAGDGVAP